ncbi:MAG TPA: hypothetical protein PKA76_19520 [Pirellulaceae bacterium]|nr:hypothetical protein [Pirellulaceae bacterium]
MTLDKIRAGIVIAQKYYDDPDSFHFGAEHDEIFLYATDRCMDAADVSQMIELGWRQDVEPKGDEMTVADYDPSEGWRTFV